jgi:hypothetical protein
MSGFVIKEGKFSANKKTLKFGGASHEGQKSNNSC